MMLTYHQAAELGEALLDAAKMAEDQSALVGVIRFRGFMVATRVYDEDEAIIVVMPTKGDEAAKIVPIRGSF